MPSIDVHLRMNPKAWNLLRRRIDGARVHVGILAANGGKEKHPDSDLSLIEIAAIHEFGSPAARIPQRSFIRSAFEKEHPALGKMCARLVQRVLKESITLEQAMEILGQWGVKTVQARMVEGIPPPLAPMTLARRANIQKTKVGRDIPLINTGHLRKSLSYEVQVK